MAVYFLDTTVLIDRMRGHPMVAERLASLAVQGHTLAWCAVSVAEFYSNLRAHDETRAYELFSPLAYQDIKFKAAQQAGRLRYAAARRGRALHTPDALIGGLALDMKAALLTKNVSHFALIPGLVIEELPPE